MINDHFINIFAYSLLIKLFYTITINIFYLLELFHLNLKKIFYNKKDTDYGTFFLNQLSPYNMGMFVFYQQYTILEYKIHEIYKCKNIMF